VKAEFVRQVISLALRLRARENLKLKQPLKTLFVKAGAEHIETVKLFAEVLCDEINVKEIEVVGSDDRFNVPYLTVNFKAAGAILKGEVQKLKTAVENLGQKDMGFAVAGFDGGKVTVGAFKNLPSNLFEKKLKSKTEFVSETENDLTVVLDTTLDEALIEEGILRETIRAVQVERQNKDLEITARIKLTLRSNDANTLKIIKDNSTKICADTLATDIKVEKGDSELEILIKLA